jgi:uncharacterized membrane protein YfcA
MTVELSTRRAATTAAALLNPLQHAAAGPTHAAARVDRAGFARRAALVGLIGWMLFGSWELTRTFSGDGTLLGAATALAILLSAFVSSIAGFAFSALAGSALAYLKVDPFRAVQMMVVCSLATQLYAVWTIREAIRWRPLLPMIAAGAATVPLGVWTLRHADALIYAAGLGIFLIGYGCMVALRRDGVVLRANAWRDAAAGALGGLAGGLAGIPGAFVTILCSMRGWDKLRQRAVYQPYILAMQLVAIVCLHWNAHARIELEHDMNLVPFALLGAIGGLAVFRRMSNQQFQVAVSALLVVSGMGLLARAL